MGEPWEFLLLPSGSGCFSGGKGIGKSRLGILYSPREQYAFRIVEFINSNLQIVTALQILSFLSPHEGSCNIVYIGDDLILSLSSLQDGVEVH